MDSFWEIWNFHEKVGRKKNKKKQHDCISSRKFFPTPKSSSEGEKNTSRERFKKFKGYPLIEFKNFPKKLIGGVLWSPLYFWKHKKTCGLVRMSCYPASETPEN